MNLFVLYFATFFVGLVSWILFYKTRKTREDSEDAIALGIVLVTAFVSISTLVITLAIFSVLNG